MCFLPMLLLLKMHLCSLIQVKQSLILCFEHKTNLREVRWSFILSMILFVLTVLMQFCQNLAESVRNWIQDWYLQVTQRLHAEGDELDLKKSPVLAFPSSWMLFNERRGSLPERCCADQPGWSWGVLLPQLASIRSVCNACSLQGGLTQTLSVAYTEDGQKHRSSSYVNKALNSSAS